MGGHPWMYFVDYDRSIEHALHQLKEREFAAGRYNPVMPFLPCPIEADSPAPGSGHADVQEAREAAAEDGTRSILDIDRVGDERDYGTVAALSEGELLDQFGTTQPTRGEVESSPDFMEDIERGQGVYLIVFDDGRPAQICFAGYSYD